MTVKEAAEAIADALDTVYNLRVYTVMGANIDPPGAVVGPPALKWESFCQEPTSATFLIYLTMPVSERTLEKLWDLVPQVAKAIETVPDAVVTRADPGVYPSGGQDLPAYVLHTELSL